MNKKAVFDLAIYAIPSVFLLILMLFIFSFYFATISKDLPIVDIATLDDDALALINYLKTPVNDEETISDLMRQSIEKDDFTELEKKTNELFRDFTYQISIYEQNNILIKRIGEERINPNTEIILPTKDKTIIIKFYLK